VRTKELEPASVKITLNCKQKTVTSPITLLGPEKQTQAQLTLHNYVLLKESGTEIQFFQQQKPLSKKSELLTLNRFPTNDGILRVGSCLRQSDFPDNQKHPTLLPRHSILPDIIIRSTVTFKPTSLISAGLFGLI
jgi:hypothetical protein